ncbi:RagB/SusD family nutrient uptake outer membrane protein [uncultured Draconibacterium sp.]|uniref:RagB/SusD family nutrient uptake outer membrane protein n=1 Tax=uncultured Draconibacterium sp. TaxID=1573823 RepID=UPI0025DB1218|nr:RagB/SusD family nutrient uptake outer membrane protein [uncultured Draconibacterium sp.]
MKNKIKVLLSVLAGILILNSCNEDELEQVNPNKVTSESFWATMDDCEQGVNAIYNAFKSKNLMLMLKENERADMGHKPASWADGANAFYKKTFNNAENNIQNKWAALYEGVFRANQAIEGLEKYKSETTNLDEEAWNDLYAQAVFFRGLFHYYLYSSFNEGSIPIRNKVPKTMAEQYVAISPAEEVFNFFMEDLQFAYTEGFLPDVWNAGDEGKITRGAVAAVIGQAYLYEGEYNQAMVYLKDVIDNYGYALTDDPADNVTTHAEFNSESILEINYSYSLKPEEAVNSDEGLSAKYVDDISPVEAQWGGAMFPSYWLQLAYKEDPMDSTDERNLAPVIDIPTGEVLKAADGTDSMAVRKHNLRASAYISFVDDEAQHYYLDRPAFTWNWNVGTKAAFKFLSNCNEFHYDDLPNEETYKSGVNYRVIRLADVYLMYAECLIQGGNNDGGVQEALAYINKVRYRSALQLLGNPGEFAGSTYDGKSYSAQDVMNQLMYVERPLEISIMGHATRHIDLRRWGIYKERFQELADKRYASGSYPPEIWSDVEVDGVMKRKYLFPNANQGQRIVNPNGGNPIIRWGCVIYDASYFDNAVGWDLKDYNTNNFLFEYEESAANYIESEHAYWPIPLVEETTNPNIYGSN